MKIKSVKPVNQQLLALDAGSLLFDVVI